MTKDERIAELERKVAALESRQPTEYHYHFDRPVYYGPSSRCWLCGAAYADVLYHVCHTAPYWNPPTYGPLWSGGTYTTVSTGADTNVSQVLDEAMSIVTNSGGLA